MAGDTTHEDWGTPHFVSVYYDDTHLGDLEYSFSISDKESSEFRCKVKAGNRIVALAPRPFDDSSYDAVLSALLGEASRTAAAVLCDTEAVTLLERIDHDDFKPPACAEECRSSGAACGDCETWWKRHQLRNRKKRAGCSCCVASYLPPSLAGRLEEEEYAAFQQRNQAGDRIVIVPPEKQTHDEIVNKVATNLAEELVNGVLSEEGLVEGARQLDAHTKEVSQLLNKAADLEEKMRAYRESILPHADVDDSKGALEMAERTLGHSQEWLARAVPAGNRPALLARLKARGKKGRFKEAAMHTASVALSLAGLEQTDIVDKTGLSTPTVRRYLLPLKQIQEKRGFSGLGSPSNNKSFWS